MGTTQEAETDTSGRLTLYIYYNSLIPDYLELPSGENEVTYIFIAAMSTDDVQALDDFVTGNNHKMAWNVMN